MKTIQLISKEQATKTFALFIILMTLFFSHPAQAADDIKSGDVLYVWAKTGLNLRQSPSIYAKKLSILMPGSRVEVLGFTQKSFAIETLAATEEEENPFVIKGNWILVQVGDVQGFVLDTYLLPIAAPKDGQSMKHYLIARSEEISALGNEDEAEYSFGANAIDGMSINYESGEDYRNISIELPNFTIEDGFVFYNFFKDIQSKSTAEDASVSLFKNWKEELLLYSEDAEIIFQIIDDKLVISEEEFIGC